MTKLLKSPAVELSASQSEAKESLACIKYPKGPCKDLIYLVQTRNYTLRTSVQYFKAGLFEVVHEKDS